MNKTIEISDENYEFLKDFMNRIKTQDNRATASPYFYVVQCRKEIAVPLGTTGKTRYFDSNSSSSYTLEELKKWFKEWKDDDMEWDNEKDEEEFEKYKRKYCEKYDIDEIEEEHNVFFTEEGYNQHIKLNGHNYRHYNKFYSYIKHAFRNPELTGLFKALEDVVKE